MIYIDYYDAQEYNLGEEFNRYRDNIETINKVVNHFRVNNFRLFIAKILTVFSREKKKGIENRKTEEEYNLKEAKIERERHKRNMKELKNKIEKLKNQECKEMLKNGPTKKQREKYTAKKCLVQSFEITKPNNTKKEEQKNESKDKM